MEIQSDITALKVTKNIKKDTKPESINIEKITIFSSYEILEDGTRIFSAED